MSEFDNVALVTREGQFDNELNLLELVAFIKQNFRILLGGALIGSLLGLAMTFIYPTEWEASALVRIGRLGNVESGGNSIEPALQLVDRIKSKSFQNEVLKELGISITEGNTKAEMFRDTLKVKLEKSELINLTLRSTSPDEAKQHIAAIIHDLKNIHERMSTPTLNRWQQELASIEEELKRASTESERLTKSLASPAEAVSENSFSQSVLLSNILIAREGELRNFRERKRILEEQLSPERSFATNVLGRIEVSTKPVFPKKSLFVIVGLVVGLLLGGLLSMLKSIGCQKNSSIKSN